MRLAICRASIGMLLMAVLLAGCGENVELKKRAALAGNHVSPPPVAVPRLPAGTFDQAKGADLLRSAAAAREGGGAPAARKLAEAAVASWPGDRAAWQELEADCTAQGDDACAGYAAFFGAKVEFVNTLPPRAAVLGFASLAAEPVGTHSGNYVYDRHTLDTALRLASFYDEQDILRELRGTPKVTVQNAKP